MRARSRCRMSKRDKVARAWAHGVGGSLGACPFVAEKGDGLSLEACNLVECAGLASHGVSQGVDLFRERLVCGPFFGDLGRRTRQ